MSFFDDSVKKRISEATDIVELVSQHMTLRRSGRIYKGLCPWHDDSKPSLQVDPVRQSFKCWVCDVGGDVFSFVMKMENVSFPEAMEILADRAGITLPKKRGKKILLPQSPSIGGDPNAELYALGLDDDHLAGTPTHLTSENEKSAKEVSKQTLFGALEWVAKQYHDALLTLDEAEEARHYLKKRGIDESDIRKFQIGYAPLQRDWLVDKLKRIPERLQIMEIVGNLRRSQEPSRSQEYYEPFRGRVLFPIRDTQNRTVAFGGRLIPNSPITSPAKYVNTIETPLFSKHQMLYGLDIARHTMKTTRRALIVEGYTDVIVAHKFGFGDAVAVLGTALGPDHVRILKRYVEKMILLLDGDEAGRKRADQVLEHFVAQGADMSVLTLPGGLDPADFLEQHGTEAMEVLLKTETVDALDHAFRSATRDVDVKNDIIASSRALDTVLDIVAKTPLKAVAPDDPVRIRTEKMIQKLSLQFLLPEDKIRQRLDEKRRRLENQATRSYDDNYEPGTVSPGSVAPQLEWEMLPDALEREMLELWLADPTAIYEFWETVPPQRCRSPITRAIYEKCNALVEKNKPATFDWLLVAFDDPKMKSYLVELYESGRKKRTSEPSPIIGDGEPEPPGFRDEVSDLEESLRSETEEEQPISPELRERLIREIFEGFDRRDAARSRIEEVNRLRGDDLTEKEKADELLRLQEKLQRMQAEKRRRLGMEN